MHKKILLSIVILLMSLSALSQAQAPSTWGTLKATYANAGPIESHDKVVFPDPWPFSYTRVASISDTDAKRAMMRCGLQYLTTCSNVHVMSSTNSVGNGDIAMVTATRPNAGDPAIWTVDLDGDLVAHEFTVTSLNVNSITVYDVLNDETITASTIDAAAEDEDVQDHLETYVDENGFTQGNDGWWSDIKNAWNDLNLCEQVHVVGGIVVCSAAGSFGAGVLCGAGFFVSASTNC